MSLKAKYNAFKTDKFNNRLPLHVNTNHFLYDSLNRLIHNFSNSSSCEYSSAAANVIKTDGYALAPNIVPQEILSKIQTKVNDLYDSGAEIDYEFQKAGMLRIKNCLHKVPECEDLMYLPEVQSTFSVLYGGGWRVFNVEIYRTMPKLDNSSFYSDAWHCDNVTPNMLKFFVNLTDVRQDTGAMRILPKPASHQFKKQGFITRSDGSKFGDEIDKASVALEGSAGTGVFFQPQHCLHKAIIPQKLHRDVVGFMIYPYLGKQKKLSNAEKTMVSGNRSYMHNPFTGSGI